MITHSLANGLWETVRSDFQSLFPHDIYRTWFEPLRYLGEDEKTIRLAAPSGFAAIWIVDNYRDLINRKLTEAAGRSMSVDIVVQEEASTAEETEDAARVEETREAVRTVERSSQTRFVTRGSDSKFTLNPRNTFENFVIGSGNQLAHAAAIAVANAPAKAYNPLFLYGDTGLGKTHLMHAISHQMLNNRAEAQIAYISTEKFTNEYIEAIQNNSVSRFRARYRKADILLIDDIHFLSGKERIQEEFFHTFNELFEQQKQIVLSSDRPAGEIARLESRLVSRFQWGLVADIQAPDYETRLAIIRKKAQGLPLPEEVLHFLAERVSRNVRRLEGALTRVTSYAALTNNPLDLVSVERLLHDILQEEAQAQVTVEKIQQKVADYHKLSVGDMKSKRRPANIAFPRQIAMYLSRMMTSHSLQEIGDEFGGRDHGTVIHACKTVENMMEQNDGIARTVEYLKKQLSSSR